MIDAEGKGAIKLIVAKSKITPLKSVTLPRLKLVAALVTAKLISHVKRVIDLNIDRVCCWSDSQITLCWIRNVARTWKPFVKNRVESIHELVKPEDWRYCPTKDNPADVITRGTTLKKLKDNNLWWNGPKWLHNENQWPKERLQRTVTKKIENIIEEEQRPTLVMLNVNVTIPPIFEFERFGNFKKMLRLTAYCKRFVSNYENGLLRVGGRLRLSDLDYEMKYPIILPKKHHIVNLIIGRAHSNTLHAGNNQTLMTLRQNF
ncbi:hypothetical protein T4C_8238 [Trichinella pseudospiralis]|nr:hypothetical protein T4C_8238 [Trichinella pseudospiralis]